MGLHKNYINNYCCIRYKRGPMHFKSRPMGPVPYYWIWQAWDRSHVCSKEVYGTACMHRLGINSICLMLVKSQLTPKNEKIKVVSNWLKWREKLVRNYFRIIWRYPLQKKNVVQRKLNCFKLAVMARKFVRYYFKTFWHQPPPQKKKLGKMTKNQTYIKEDSLN